MKKTRIDPGLSIGAVALTVADLERSVAFYRNALGFRVHARREHTARLGAGASDLLDLREIPDACRTRHTTGLYHAAVLLPSRVELARAILRLSAARTRIQGASDHGVSEAIYLADSEGNGIEIYRDRPREEWPRERGGALRIPTDPLDLEGILREAPRGKVAPGAKPHGKAATGTKPHGETAAAPVPPETRIGHVHLHVADLGAAERFYVDVLGFDVAMRYGSEALFVSAGGYHHHIGLNTWAGEGAPPPPEDSRGLRWFELAHTSEEERDRTAGRVAAAGVKLARTVAGYLIHDPSRNGIRLTAPRAAARAGAHGERG